MSEHDQDDRLIELDEGSCRQLLGGSNVGRIAINGDPSPEIFPVNYAVRDGDILFRTADGTKQEAAASARSATFEVDGVEADRQSAWSVVVHGILEPVPEDEYEDLPEPLAGGQRPHPVRLRIRQISGRRIPPQAGWSPSGRSWKDRDASDLMG